MGALIRAEGLLPDLVLASDSERTRETLVLVTAVADYRGPTRLMSELYHGDEDEYLRQIAALPQDVSSVMLIGHNPILETLVTKLSGVEVGMKPATLVRILLPIDDWADAAGDATGNLSGVWQPRDA